VLIEARFRRVGRRDVRTQEADLIVSISSGDRRADFVPAPLAEGIGRVHEPGIHHRS
jgi:hypothetical protein